jgi:hypothetical protein
MFNDVSENRARRRGGVPSDPVSLFAEETQSFLLEVTTGKSVTCSGTKVSGQGNMYLRWDQLPDVATQEFDWSSINFTRTCTVNGGAQHNAVWILVEALTDLQSLGLTCSSAYPSAITLTNAIPSQPINLSSGKTRLYKLAVTRGAEVACGTTADEGSDADIFLRFTEKPDKESGDYDCSGTLSGSTEQCVVTNDISAQILWILVFAESGIPVSNVVVEYVSTMINMTEAGAAISLQDGIASDPFSLDTDQTQIFTLDVEAGSEVTCQTSGDNGDADLSLRWGTEPDLANVLYDCESTTASSDEECTVQDLTGETVLWATVVSFLAVS